MQIIAVDHAAIFTRFCKVVEFVNMNDILHPTDSYFIHELVKHLKFELFFSAHERQEVCENAV